MFFGQYVGLDKILNPVYLYQKRYAIDLCMYIFLAVFTVEMTIKVSRAVNNSNH